jgi:GTP-binding protein LepA
LGLLHLDIVKERLLREFDMDVIMTSPQVTYRIKIAGDKSSDYSRFETEVFEEHGQIFTYIYISNPEDLPPREKYLSIEEPIAKIEIITPQDYV